MEAGRDTNIDFTGRELFQIEWDAAGFNLNEIVNHENTRYDIRLKTWGLGDEIGMSHCHKYRNLNQGTDWIIYLTYHDDQNSEDFYFQFSVVPPRPTDIWLAIRGLRKPLHFPIVAYEMSHQGYLDNESYFLSPLPSYCQKLTNFMEQCYSWHGPPDLRIA